MGTISTKQLIKVINTIYGEKAAAGRTFTAVQGQSLASFLFDSFINKYGLLNVAERKLKEILLTVAMNRQKLARVELFARFLGLSEVKYSSDDLQFMFSFAQRLFQKYHLEQISIGTSTLSAPVVRSSSSRTCPSSLSEIFRP